MSDSKLPEDLEAAIERYLDLKRQAHAAGAKLIKSLPEGCQLPHGVEMHLVGDIFVNYVFQNGACRYLTDLAVNFTARFKAWAIAQSIQPASVESVKLRVDDWPEVVGGDDECNAKS